MGHTSKMFFIAGAALGLAATAFGAETTDTSRAYANELTADASSRPTTTPRTSARGNWSYASTTTTRWNWMSWCSMFISFPKLPMKSSGVN